MNIYTNILRRESRVKVLLSTAEAEGGGSNPFKRANSRRLESSSKDRQLAPPDGNLSEASQPIGQPKTPTANLLVVAGTSFTAATVERSHTG